MNKQHWEHHAGQECGVSMGETEILRAHFSSNSKSLRNLYERHQCEDLREYTVCVCVCIYFSLCVYVNVCMHVYLCTCVFLSICVSVCLYVDVCLCECVSLCVVSLSVCMSVCLWACVCLCYSGFPRCMHTCAHSPNTCVPACTYINKR